MTPNKILLVIVFLVLILFVIENHVLLKISPIQMLSVNGIKTWHHIFVIRFRQKLEVKFTKFCDRMINTNDYSKFSKLIIDKTGDYKTMKLTETVLFMVHK